MNNTKPYIRSLSNEDFKTNYPNPSAEGLRKLAVNYKNSKQGQIDFERFRTSTKIPKKPIDPRFRKTRVAPSCEVMTKTDFKVHQPKSPYNNDQVGSATGISSLPSTPKRSPRKRSKVPVLRNISQTTPELSSAAEAITMVTNTCSKDSPKLENSSTAENSSVQVDYFVEQLEKMDAQKLIRIEEDIERLQSNEKVLAWRNTSEENLVPVETIKHADPPPSRVKMAPAMLAMTPETKKSDPLIESASNKAPFLEKYVSIPVEIRVKKSKSALTIPFSFPKTLSPRVCMCVKCSCIMTRNQDNNYENKPSMGDGSHIVTNPHDYPLPKSWTQSQRMQTVISWCCYIFALLFALLMVACFGWFISTDYLWNWVKEPQRKPAPLIYSLLPLVTYCGNIALSTINFIFGTIANILLLPRNSVYSVEGSAS